MTLGQAEMPAKPKVQPSPAQAVDPLAPKLVEQYEAASPTPKAQDTPVVADEAPVHFSLGLTEDKADMGNIPGKTTVELARTSTVENLFTSDNHDSVNSLSQPPNPSSVISSTGSVSEPTVNPVVSYSSIKDSNGPLPAASGGYLARPSNIYAEAKAEATAPVPSAEKPVPPPTVAAHQDDDLADMQMQLVEKDDIPAADKPLAHQAQPPLSPGAEDLAMHDEAEDQKRRSADRLHKLRNLSFNVNGSDPNNEFETVPAYIRRNMELYNSSSHIENFYSSYEVKTDKNNKTQISTINTFLDGKKPD